MVTPIIDRYAIVSAYIDNQTEEGWQKMLRDISCTLTERQRQVLELALRYAYSNTDDVCDSFTSDSAGNLKVGVRGRPVSPPAEEEFVQLIHFFRGEDP